MRKYQLWFSYILLLGCFLLSRLPYFLYFPIPGGFASSDTFEYFKVALEMERGVAPLFEFRTPGYPFFVFLIGKFSKQVSAVIIAQNAITLLASMLFTFSVYRTFSYLTIPAALALVFYFMGNNIVEADTNVLTNSLYANFLLLFLAVLLPAVKKNRFWALLSVLAGMIILIRPSGLFLLPLIALLVVYLMLRRNYSGIARLLLPLSALLFALAVYNYKTLHIFAISPFGGLALSGTVTTYLDTEADYGECANGVVKSVDAQVSQQDKEILKTSCNPDELHEIFYANFYWCLTIYKDIMKTCGYSGYLEALPTIKKIATDAIRKHPEYYAKFVLTSFYNYIVTGNLKEHQLFYYSEVQRRYHFIYTDKRPLSPQLFSTYVPDTIPVALKKFTYKEMYDAKDPVGFDARQQGMVAHWSFRLFDLYTLRINRVFLRNWFWPLAITVLFVASGILFLLSRFRNTNALIIFAVCCILFCSAAVVSLVEPSFYHYTSMTEFTYYLAVALSPILLKKK